MRECHLNPIEAYRTPCEICGDSHGVKKRTWYDHKNKCHDSMFLCDKCFYEIEQEAN